MPRIDLGQVEKRLKERAETSGINYLASYYQTSTHKDATNRLLTFTATTDDIDLDHDVILPDGAEEDSYFFKNRNIFGDHCYGINEGVGRLRSYARTSLPSGREGWKCSVALFGQGRSTYDPVRLMEYAETGGLAWSIGFRVLDERDPTDEDIRRYGEKVANIITRWHWQETSATLFPCNVNCRTGSVSIDGKAFDRVDNMLRAGTLTEKQVEILGGSVKAPSVEVLSSTPSVELLV